MKKLLIALIISFISTVPSSFANVKFATAISFGTGGTKPNGIVTGDLNGDGNADLIILNETENTVSILLGDGAGSFRPAVPYALGSVTWPTSVAVADFDGDGNLDLAVTIALNGTNGGDVRILLGNGDGTFHAPVSYRTNSSPLAIVAGDVNGDGKIDLFIGGNGNLALLFGNGDGSFQAPRNLQVSLVNSALNTHFGVALADLNRDGLQDLITSDYQQGSDSTVAVFLQNPDGSFQPAQVYHTGWQGADGLALADLNADGILDLVVANDDGNTTTVFLGRGDGTLITPGTYYYAGLKPLSVIIADFDQDKKLDLGFCAYGDGAVSILPGNGDGSFNTHQFHQFPADAGCAALAAGDFNRDGAIDLATVSLSGNTASVLLNSSQLRRSHDFNGNGTTDLLWRNESTGELAIWLMSGPTVLSYNNFGLVSDPNWKIIATADFDGDGKADILWRNRSTGVNAIWTMDGSKVLSYGNFSLVTDQNWMIVGVGDFDGDGRADIMWRNQSTGENAIWLMGGPYVLSYNNFSQVADLNWSVAGVADFDGDGKADILWRNTSTGENAIWIMNGASVKFYCNFSFVPDQSWKVAGLGDFNGDGKSDILWRNTVTGENALWLMNGASVQSYSNFSTVANPNWQISQIGDFNADGKADILWRNVSTGENAIWLMNGTAVMTYEDFSIVTDQNWVLH